MQIPKTNTWTEDEEKYYRIAISESLPIKIKKAVDMLQFNQAFHGGDGYYLAFSGGKDSTLLLQLVWNSILRIDPVLRSRRIYVVCNDTMVENPKVVKFINKTLSKIRDAANMQGVPFSVEQTTPKIDDTF